MHIWAIPVLRTIVSFFLPANNPPARKELVLILELTKLVQLKNQSFGGISHVKQFRSNIFWRTMISFVAQ